LSLLPRLGGKPAALTRPPRMQPEHNVPTVL
jgi:hypothetical protein